MIHQKVVFCTKNLLDCDGGWLLSRLVDVHISGRHHWTKVLDKNFVEVNWISRWHIRGSSHFWLKQPDIGIGPLLSLTSSCRCATFGWEFYIFVPVCHGLISEHELMMFVTSSCSCVCCYQPLKGLLKIFGITITRYSTFPRMFNVSRLEYICCIGFVALTAAFWILSGCLESLSQWHKLLVPNDTEWLPFLHQVSIDAPLKWWVCLVYKNNQLSFEQRLRSGSEAFQFCWQNFFQLSSLTMLLTPLIPLLWVTLLFSSLGVVLLCVFFMSVRTLFNIVYW